jgi:hypothetical protein
MEITYVYLISFFFSAIILSIIFWKKAWEKRITIVFISSIFAFIPNTIFNGIENNRLDKTEELMKVKQISCLGIVDSVKVYAELRDDSTGLFFDSQNLFENYARPNKWEVRFISLNSEKPPRIEIYADIAKVEKEGWSAKSLMPKTNRKKVIYFPKDSTHLEIVRIWKIKNKKNEEDNS